jgi:elongation factor G
MDRENAEFERNVADIQATFGRHCVPFQVPVGQADSLKDVVNVADPNADVPADLSDEVEGARERLIEAAAESDDELADRYLSGEELTAGEIESALRGAVLKGELVPILCSSATVSVGVAQFMDMIRSYLPSPMDGVKRSLTKAGSDDAVAYEADPSAPLAALVFKTTADPFVGKLSLFRVFQGSIKSNSEVWDASQGQSERVGQLYLPKGKSQENLTELTAGDIGAVGKLSSTVTGDTLCARDNQVTFEPIVMPVGYYRVAVSPASKADLDKMSLALSRIVEEDPSLQMSRNATTSETLLTGLGEAQIDVAIDKIKRKFGADLRVRLPRVPYRETITRTTQSEYRHKKQSGGHGQFGHVNLRLEPMDRDQGFQFGNEVVGGRVPREYIPSVEKGVVKALDEGALAGYPIVDLKAVLFDGSFHSVDSSGMSFEIASIQALKKGVSEASPILLEPVMRLSVTVPDSYTGDVMSDLNVKRGRILGMNPQDRVTVIDAEVPQSELLRYAQDLRSLSQGRGSYSMVYDHYEPVPANLEQRVIEEAKRLREDDE